MPGSGVHITVVERLAAADPQIRGLLGDPFSSNDEKIAYAKLGAVGPDMFFFLADYKPVWQELETFVVKFAGTTACLGELSAQIGSIVNGGLNQLTFDVYSSIQQTTGLLTGILKNGFLRLLFDAGYNPWVRFRPERQRDHPLERWFWVDYLHYVSTGQFTRKLVENAGDNPRLRAYALGYLAHYVTDVVGHAYVNQVVQAPWRLYWQRHHLVENFMDSYIWDRFHVPQPGQSGAVEPPLDRLVTTPNQTGAGAQFTFARLNDHVNIGHHGLGDPIDGVVERICQKIHQGLFDLGVAEDLDVAPETGEQFREWCEFLAKAIRDVYLDGRHPTKLAGNGLPTADDIAGAYGVMRLLLKIETEEGIQDPQPPQLGEHIGDEIQRLLDDLKQNLAAMPAPPTVSTDAGFSLENFADAVAQMLQWLAEAVTQLAKTVFDFLRDLVGTVGTVATAPIRYALWLLDKALFALYRHVRFALCLHAYKAPFTEELARQYMVLYNSSALWQSLGNLPDGSYPVEEIRLETVASPDIYPPFIPPAKIAGGKVERPPVTFAAPFEPVRRVKRDGTVVVTPLTPDVFIDAPAGKDDMFSPQGPLPAAVREGLQTFADNPRDFGGALVNCVRGIQIAVDGFKTGTCPDYNLDADRGYAWLAWDARSPLDPFNTADSDPGTAHVNAVRMTT